MTDTTHNVAGGEHEAGTCEPCEVLTLSRRQRLAVVVGSAIVVAVAFQAITIARNNYNLWRLEFMGIEWGFALLGSWAAGLVGGLDERGRAWAASLVPSRMGWAYRVLVLLPEVAVRAAIITACVSLPNATYIPVHIYRETIGNPVVAVLVRFLADIPQAVALCLAVRLLLPRFVHEK